MPGVDVIGQSSAAEGRAFGNLSGISNENFFGKMLRAPLRLIPRTAVVRILQGPLRGKKWIVGSSNHGCWLGSFEYQKQRLFARLVRPGDVVYDVGANVGFYTLLSAVLCGEHGHVYAFEPLPRNLLDLRRHLEMNGMRHCSVIAAAACRQDGQARFDASLERSQTHLSPTGEILVKTVALDTLVARGQIRPPGFMKIDIEGAELECLHGSAATIEQHRPAILLATHGSDAHRECLTLLQEWKYDVESVDRRPLESTDEILARPREARV